MSKEKENFKKHIENYDTNMELTTRKLICEVHKLKSIKL